MTLAEAEILAVKTLKSVMEEKLSAENIEVAKVTTEGYELYKGAMLTDPSTASPFKYEPRLLDGEPIDACKWWSPCVLHAVFWLLLCFVVLNLVLDLESFLKSAECQ